jgi:hypothetical protein
MECICSLDVLYSLCTCLPVKCPLKSSMGKIWQFSFIIQMRLCWQPFYWSTAAHEGPLRDTSISRFHRILTQSTPKFMKKQLQIIIIIISWAVPWLTQLVAGLTPRRFKFGSKPIQLGFLMDKLELGQVPARVLRFSASVIPSTIHTYSFTHHRCSLILVTDGIVK